MRLFNQEITSSFFESTVFSLSSFSCHSFLDIMRVTLVFSIVGSHWPVDFALSQHKGFLVSYQSPVIRVRSHGGVWLQCTKAAYFWKSQKKSHPYESLNKCLQFTQAYTWCICSCHKRQQELMTNPKLRQPQERSRVLLHGCMCPVGVVPSPNQSRWSFGN